MRRYLALPAARTASLVLGTLCLLWGSGFLLARDRGQGTAPTTPLVRVVPTVGPADSVALGQEFRVELVVPDSDGRNATWDASITTPSGDEVPVTLTKSGSVNGLTTYQSAPMSFSGSYGGREISTRPFGLVGLLAGSVTIGEFHVAGTTSDLGLSNGDAVMVNVSTPAWSAGTSMQVFETQIDQALHRGYTGLYTWHTQLLNELRLSLALKTSGIVTDQATLDALNTSIATNNMLLSWIADANQWLATEQRPFAQFAILSNYLANIAGTYENGLRSDDQLNDIRGQIRSQIEQWRGTVPESYLQGVALAFYNGVTAIPLVSSGYTLASSAYTSATTGSFSTGQTVWGSEATTGQWVWAVVDTGLTGMALVRMMTGPGATGGAFDPLRTPARAPLIDTVKGAVSAVPVVAQQLTPYEVGLWNYAAGLTKRMVRQGMPIDEINRVQEINLRLVNQIAQQAGLPNVTRVLDAMNAAAKAQQAIDMDEIIRRAMRTPPPPPPLGAIPTPNLRVGPPPPGSVAFSGAPLMLSPSLMKQVSALRRTGDAAIARQLEPQLSLIEHACRRPRFARIAGNGMARALTQSELVDLTAAWRMLRGGPGRGSFAPLPLLGAMQQQFGAAMDDDRRASASSDPVDLKRLANDVIASYSALDPWMSSYRLGSGDANTWHSTVPPGVRHRAFGHDAGTYYLGDDPWDGVSWDDAVGEFLAGDGDALDRWMDAIEPDYADDGFDDGGQGVAALLRTIFGRAAVIVVPPYYGAATTPPAPAFFARRFDADAWQRPAARDPAITVTFTSSGRLGPGGFTMSVVNTGPVAATVVGDAVALRPLKTTPSQAARAHKDLARYPQVTVDVDAYCQDFSKRPPAAGAVYALAPARQQADLIPMRRIARAVTARRATFAPDMDRDQYAHAIAQWALWTSKERWDERAFTRAFVQHSQKNVVSARQRWTTDLERQVTALAPARWQAIRGVLREAGLPDRR